MTENVVSLPKIREQAAADAFYWSRGPCCAGCDWWRHINSVCGECTKSAPVSGHERTAMLGMRFNNVCPGAGHVMTNREHLCGDFVDSFEWRSLAPKYLRSIGFKGVTA